MLFHKKRTKLKYQSIGFRTLNLTKFTARKKRRGKREKAQGRLMRQDKKRELREVIMRDKEIIKASGPMIKLKSFFCHPLFHITLGLELYKMTKSNQNKIFCY